MSSYYKQTKNPTTGEWENALWLDDKFGQHRYGVEFPSTKGTFYNPDEIKLETRMPENNKMSEANNTDRVEKAIRRMEKYITTAIEEARREERREIITAYKQTTGIDDDVFIRALEALSQEQPTND